MREYAPRTFDRLKGLTGFSDARMQGHLLLYTGHVANVNHLSARLAAMLKEGRSAVPEYAELSRRFAWEFNGMRLHELFFDGLSKTPRPLDTQSLLHSKILDDFSSMADWETDFRATATTRGPGWAALYHDPVSGRLHDSWIEEHDESQLAGCTPLLVVDVHEHAYLQDYGAQRPAYLDAVMRHLDWVTIAGRLRT